MGEIEVFFERMCTSRLGYREVGGERGERERERRMSARGKGPHIVLSRNGRRQTDVAHGKMKLQSGSGQGQCKRRGQVALPGRECILGVVDGQGNYMSE